MRAGRPGTIGIRRGTDRRTPSPIEPYTVYSPQHSQPADSIGTAAGGTISMATSNADLNWIANYIWGIADDVLRDLYVRGKYRDVILPMTVLRRLDAVLEDSKQNVLDMKAVLDRHGVVEQDSALRQAAGQAFYNTSKFTLRDLRARASRQQLTADFQAYLDGFSPNVQDILENFEFRNQIPRLSKADALGTLIEKLTSPYVNLSPAPVKNADGSVRHPGLDNHGMGSIFEELVRRFNEENNEEAGEHWTPRDAVRLMAKLVFLPVADEIKSGTYLLYDGACGTGGMLTVAEETLRQLATEHGKAVSTHLFGQGDQRRDLRHLQGRPAAEGRGRRSRQHHRRPRVLHPRQRRLPVPRVRLHALEPALRQELEDRPGAHGRQEGHARPALRHRARRRSRVLPGHPLQRRPDALPRQQALEDEAGHPARQPQSDSVKVGYEVSFTRYFYQPKPMRTLAEIRADILALEQETEGLSGEIFALTAGMPPTRLRVYADTSTIGGCDDDEFRVESRRLFDDFRNGRAILVLSELTLRELAAAPAGIRAVIDAVPGGHTEMLEVSDEAERLAAAYVDSGALEPSQGADALHVALASLARVDVLASWNFRHMVSLRRIRAYNDVNRRLGCPALDIRTPKEVNDAA